MDQRMKGKILVFGEKWGVVERVRSLGYAPVLINHNRSIVPKEFLEISIEQAVSGEVDLEVFDQYASDDVQGIVVCSDFYVELAAAVREKYFPSLKGLTIQQALSVRDKVELKRCLDRYGIPTTKYVVLDKAKPFEEISRALGSPFLVKPRKGVLAQGIHIVTTENEWNVLMEQPIDFSKIYAEEYVLNVREYCCDTVVADGKILAQFPGEYTVSCLESNKRQEGIGVNFPGFLPPPKIEELKTLSAQFVQSHKIKDGFCHIECLFSKEGWKFGEIGCRLPGGYQLPTESYLADASLIDLFLRTLIMSEPTPVHELVTKNRYFGYYLFPRKAGVVENIHLDIEHPWIVEAKVHVKKGQVIEFEDSSVTNAAHIVYQADSLSQLSERSRVVPTLMDIHVC